VRVRGVDKRRAYQDARPADASVRGVDVPAYHQPRPQAAHQPQQLGAALAVVGEALDGFD